MRSLKSVRLTCILSILGCSLSLQEGQAQSKGDSDGLRKWTVEDSIAVRYFVRDKDDDPEEWVTRNTGSFGEPVWFSPDGTYFFFVTHHGELACDCNHYKLWVYSTARVKKVLNSSPGHSDGVSPLREITMSTMGRNFYKSAGIRNPRWESRSTILFIGSIGVDQDALYRLDVASGELRQLTANDRYLGVYQMTKGSILYVSGTPRPNLVRATPKYPVQPIRTTYYGDLGDGHLAGTTEIYAGRGDAKPRLVASYPPMETSGYPIAPSLSPDGRWAVMMLPAYEEDADAESVRLPTGWEDYDGLDGIGGLKSPKEYDRFGLLDATSYGRMWRPALVNVETGTVRTIINAPRGSSKTAAVQHSASLFWSADSRHAVLVNSSLPLDEQLDEPAGERRTMAYLIDYDTTAARWTVLEPMTSSDGVARKVGSVGWLRGGRELLVTHVTADGKALPGTAYTLGTEGWRSRQVAAWMKPKAPDEQEPAPRSGGLSVRLKESANEPPVMMASASHKEIALTGPDPALQGIWRAPVRMVHWREPAGAVVEGGLLLPKPGTVSEPLPLVIQLGSYAIYDTHSGHAGPMRNYFLPDGAVSSAFAAQALVSQGIAVLQMEAIPNIDYPQFNKLTDPHWQYEGKLVVERVDAAVAELAQQGVIDPQKVGLIGFSRTGYLTHYLITHHGQVTPAAAIVADSTTESYYEYVSAMAHGQILGEQIRRSVQTLYGGSFWEAKKTWIDQAPLFNVEHVETPALFYFHIFSPALVPAAELLAAYGENQREIDILLAPEGGHQLQRPKQRQAELHATVDWMSFWLQGMEDSDPTKAKQYRYWRILRQQRAARETNSKN